MTIEKGKDWGRREEIGLDVPLATNDGEISDLFAIVEHAGKFALDGPELIALAPQDASERTPSNDPRSSAGGLAKTLGARAAAHEIRGHERTVVPIDLGLVTAFGAGTVHRFVVASSLVIVSRFWSGPIEGAMNSSFLGEWNVTPSGHPNDGRFDVVAANLSLSDRLKARKRLPSGSHVPHPDISIRRLKEASFTPAPSARVWIDGRLIGPAAKVDLVVFPDSVELAI